MQFFGGVGLAVGFCLVVVAVGTGIEAKTTATLQATAWLREHEDPQQDELAELKAQNPSAYAIVKALLTKRSLGLLDPKHPSASFAGPPPQAADQAPQGAEAFAKIARESGEKQATLLYPDEPAAPAHHDWLNWKPQQSAIDDDAMVADVLAEKGASRLASPKVQDTPEATEASTTHHEAETPREEERPATSGENSYLKGVDFFGTSGNAREQKHAKSLASEDSRDFLAGFSWDDDVPVKVQPASLKASQAPAENTDKGNAAPKDALLAWLSGGGKAEARQPASFLAVHGLGGESPL